MNSIFYYLAAVTLIFALVEAGVWYLERINTYAPYRSIESYPSDAGLRYEDVLLRTADGGEIHGWYVSCKGSAQTVLFLHGNAGNVSHRLQKLLLLHGLNLAVLVIDYRGYGRSTGRPVEKGLYLDAEAAYTWLLDKGLRESQIILYGESLGGSAAVDLASKRNPGGLVTECMFTSVKHMARVHYPLLHRFLLWNHYDSSAKIQRVTCPLLMFHAREDEIVPLEQGRAFFDRAPEPKQFVVLAGTHNDAVMADIKTFSKEWESFLKTITQRGDA